MTSTATTRLPGPRALPLLGATGGLLRFFSDPVDALLRLRAHGDVVSLAAPDPSLVALFGVEHNRLVLSEPRRFHNFAEPLVKVAPDASMNRITRGLTAMNGDQHRQHRKLLMPAFSRAAIEGYAPAVVEVAERFLARWQAGETRDVRADAVELTLLVSMRCLFGLSVEREAAELGRLGMQVLSGLTDLRTLAFPFDLPGTPLRRYLRLCEQVEARLRELIARRRAAGGGVDALSILLRAHDEDGTRLTDDDLVGHANVLFVAGHETTASTLSWILLLLSEHPQVAADLRDEVGRVLGGRNPTAADLEQMPLLDAVVKESMRLLPATPFLFIRQTEAPLELGAHTVPAGAKIVLSPLMTHREPDLYDDPLAFRPERWFAKQPGTYAYLPFGAGPRMCVGATFAGQATRLILAMMLQRIRPVLVDGTRVDAKCHGITMGPKSAMPMRLAAWSDGRARATGVQGNVRRLVQFVAAA